MQCSAQYDSSIYPSLPSAPPMGIKAAVHDDTLNLMRHMKGFADLILLPKPQKKEEEKPKKSKVHHLDVHYPIQTPYQSPAVIIVNQSPTIIQGPTYGRGTQRKVEREVSDQEEEEKAEKKKKDEMIQRIVTGIFAFAGLIGIGYLLGKASVDKAEDGDRTKSYDELKVRWNENRDYYDSSVQMYVDTAIVSADQIVTRNQKSTMQKIKLFIGGMTTAGFIFAGALLNEKSFTVVGIVIGAVTGILCAIKAGYGSRINRLNIRDAGTIEIHFQNFEKQQFLIETSDE